MSYLLPYFYVSKNYISCSSSLNFFFLIFACRFRKWW